MKKTLGCLAIIILGGLCIYLTAGPVFDMSFVKLKADSSASNDQSAGFLEKNADRLVGNNPIDGKVVLFSLQYIVLGAIIGAGIIISGNLRYMTLLLLVAALVWAITNYGTNPYITGVTFFKEGLLNSKPTSFAVLCGFIGSLFGGTVVK
ncbi:MAG: hypothetical protein COV55_01530 [Candidatus Komeilibacteria bacterium CG11_big_fil_rev_8_21_14_0_20_36_20]|uniref:Uncharacterized protein n=1 Tax=Candidatus Komeilibacteria bacterium CG11_big_fil_rev_8_21_14_0_20_36_20 TaxID=1974477 RepID=A0A2H0NDW9_9BACT|nr:MAG: hypothetical protein COV55_01530 [Candidatus Komeilibacteria bacterium CG11_big_fil_rev_8_21_14_0_20_36_20]PIR81223.1 MAG: hypothetical protein COU21_04515 [Candidatus Komeilibacteria bacterium CG10_big_fil_rev_8_21_14_0_10_36_65]PJC55187.1 MAG: hypothetical protein CO027_03455 [Candidatus Komeilibacteria bacterium CG_4_9_14_0_2_um_filter_36_13]